MGRCRPPGVSPAPGLGVHDALVVTAGQVGVVRVDLKGEELSSDQLFNVTSRVLRTVHGICLPA